MQTTGVIFDCDGTLLKSSEAWLEAQNEIARRAQADLNEEDLDALWQFTIPDMGIFFYEKYHLGDSPEKVVAMIYEFMAEQYKTTVKPREGALEFVKTLVESGIKCSVASVTPLPLLQTAIEVAGFAPYMKAVVSVDEVGISKRNPAVFDLALQRMGTPKESTWVFEDSAYALRTAKNAGYLTASVYDNDVAGTREELSIANVTADEFFELDVNIFISQ